MIYLDSAATSFLKPSTVEHAVIRAMRTLSSPGRGAYSLAMNAADELYSCRLSAAKLFKVQDAENIVFTSSASHSLNIAVNSMVKQGGTVLVSGFEHNSVTRPLYAAGANLITAGTKLFDVQDTIDDFERKIKSADCVFCTHVSNVFGYVLPIYEIAEVCKYNKVPLAIDASQSAGIIDVDAKRLGANFIACPGHKGLFGLQGTGILICNSETKPIIHGGSGSDSKSQTMPEYLPDRLEAGTHNIPGIAALNAGINFVLTKGSENIRNHELQMLNRMKQRLENTEYELFTGENQLGVLSLRHNRLDCEEIAQKLAEDGVCVRAGLHCAPLAHKSAGTIDTGTVRFSFSPFTDFRQIDAACDCLLSYIH